MTNTVNIKSEQLKNGYFKSGTGNENILLIGSCRVAPLVNYLEIWNNQNNNRFTITSIDPYNWFYDENNNRIDFEQKILQLETDERILSLLESTDIIIHEYYSNFGMFNFNRLSEKNIYQFGLKAKIDICIPNFNDYFILFGDIIDFDPVMRKKAIADLNVNNSISEQTQKELYDISIKNIDKFYEVCRKSDIPEMELYFKVNFLEKRFFHNNNHVSKHFTLQIFKYINEKFLKLELSKQFMTEISSYDMFDNRYTELTDLDIKWHGYNWNENIKPFIDKIK